MISAKDLKIRLACGLLLWAAKPTLIGQFDATRDSADALLRMANEELMRTISEWVRRTIGRAGLPTSPLGT